MNIRDRIVELRRVKASDLLVNPKNPRRHPDSQLAALQGVLNEVGYVDALLVRETAEGLMLIDGHARRGLTPDMEVPVLVLDLDEAEADKILLTFDPLTAMAETDRQAVATLLAEVQTADSGLQAMLDNLTGPATSEKTELKQLDTKPPPPLSWVLIGIPTVRFGEISERVEALGKVEGIILETTVSDGRKEN